LALKFDYLPRRSAIAGIESKQINGPKDANDEEEFAHIEKLGLKDLE
jgi:hypothetical protein